MSSRRGGGGGGGSGGGPSDAVRFSLAAPVTVAAMPAFLGRRARARPYFHRFAGGLSSDDASASICLIFSSDLYVLAPPPKSQDRKLLEHQRDLWARALKEPDCAWEQVAQTLTICNGELKVDKLRLGQYCCKRVTLAHTDEASVTDLMVQKLKKDIANMAKNLSVLTTSEEEEYFLPSKGFQTVKSSSGAGGDRSAAGAARGASASAAAASGGGRSGNAQAANGSRGAAAAAGGRQGVRAPAGAPGGAPVGAAAGAAAASAVLPVAAAAAGGAGRGRSPRPEIATGAPLGAAAASRGVSAGAPNGAAAAAAPSSPGGGRGASASA